MQVTGWNLAPMSKENEEAAEKHWKELEGERAHLDEEYKGDEVEREAECCQKALAKVLDAKCKENKTLRSIEDVVERQNQGEEECTGEREEEGKEV